MRRARCPLAGSRLPTSLAKLLSTALWGSIMLALSVVASWPPDDAPAHLNLLTAALAARHVPRRPDRRRVRARAARRLARRVDNGVVGVGVIGWVLCGAVTVAGTIEAATLRRYGASGVSNPWAAA